VRTSGSNSARPRPSPPATADSGGPIWYEAKRSFPGLIVWRQAIYGQMSYAQLVDAFEELAGQDDPFGLYPIIRIWPKR
jgi:hypothetical protein